VNKEPEGQNLLSLGDLHDRYRLQAGWTAELRRSLFARAGWRNLRRVLEVGSGTGAVLSTLEPGPQVFGVDLEYAPLDFTRRRMPHAHFAQANGLWLPFPEAVFDLSFCHFLLLWTPNPEQMLQEMARVTRPGGFVLALAEPDYSARIDHPPELQTLGVQQAAALRRQGANPDIGRRLNSLFHAAGLQDVEIGVLGANWSGPLDRRALESEWALLRADLFGVLPSEELDRLQALDAEAWQAGERVLYVPTFYALGRAK
jgi:SAM-dependent methyltransferase